ncbi:hypothetical protein N0V90_005848 [Kalmusia sp. IMI 367209]|nr:hypothetical protein N0V90_005848 [Kalmusia sp. IMI 367209]
MSWAARPRNPAKAARARNIERRTTTPAQKIPSNRRGLHRPEPLPEPAPSPATPCHAHAPIVNALAVAVAPLPKKSARRPRAPDAVQWYRGMNTSLTAYTHLESLLLFQSLHAYGVGPQVFSRISELLKTNPHITADKRFQSGRLSPDALRNFYLHILKEELRSEQAQPDGDAPNGDAKPSRKRKAPSPSLPTVQESLQHQHLIPKLVNKLYAHYRQAVTDQIRQDEERYERLQRELQGIERGDWDDQLRERANQRSASRSPTLPRKPPLLSQQTPPSKPGAFPLPSEANRVDGPPTLAPAPGGAFHPNLAPAKTPLSQNGQGPVKAGPSPSPRKTKIPADQQGAPSTPASQAELDHAPQPPQTPRSAASHPAQQGHPPPNAPYTGPSLANQQPYQQAHPSTPGSQIVPVPGSQHPSHKGYPPHLQTASAQLHGAKGMPQLAPNLEAKPPHDSPSSRQRLSGPHQPSPLSPSIQTPQQQKGFVPIAGQPPYVPQHQQAGQPPPQVGFMLPPFQVAPQDPSRALPQATNVPQQHQISTPVNGRQPSSKGTPHTGRNGVPPIHALNAQATSFSSPLGIRAILSALSTPTSPKTVWKASARSLGGTPVPRPDISPIDDIESFQKQEESPPKTKTTRKSRAKGKAKQKEPEPEPQIESDQQTEETVPEMETRQGRSRRKAPIKRGRPGSIASSQAGTSVRGRSRSHSILSHTETIAADSESQAGGRIKSERGASIDVADEDVAATPTQMSTRRRGAATQPNNKRKRNMREVTPEESEGRSRTPELPKTIIALRHFSRMCAPLMNDIGSHKHASTFTTAVKAKDAEGYYDIIKRPTDLKTIQKAIAAGAKQVAAAASGDTPAGSPGGAGGIVELPATPDNMPPKAIVNSSQLEKELMRMFVNAVMFNTGEEGVVEDARDMFETVQRSVSSWRSVERASGRLEVEETPPVLDDDVPAASKRRKL